LKKNDEALNTDNGFVASITNKQSFHLIKNGGAAQLTEYSE
jgi:hypothetical protein